ncbi:MAG: elongation factor Ts [Flavobacteriales bacterium]|nr:elongation factor Ts [Flavobacteriales bacterium]
MAKITAAEVNKLRKQTGAGMMDCKKALVEAEGDFDAAIDILRKKGQKVAAKRADREASEGAVLATTNADNTVGVLVSVNCETDFVAKNEGFVQLAEQVLKVAMENTPDTKEELYALSFDGSMSVEEKLTDQTGVIGEKIEVSTYEKLEAPYVAAYIHAGNKLASLVGLSAVPSHDDAGKNVAMQVAAMSPISIDKGGIDQETIGRELEVGRDLARQEGKPEEMLDRIAQGRLGKFFKENTLMSQAYIKESKQSVSDYLNSVDKGLSATAFKRVGLGG